ncbi:MAG: DUF1501 domain-containing protein [Betaproteobacteria bacterium]|nr:MAG: DUF1501 domain-containing protein [Betaproteobacteria bacterium]
MSTTNLHRRDVLRLGALAPMALSSGLLGGLVRSAYAQNVSNPADYKALVAVFMFGGNDGNNLLIPLDASGFADYTNGRGRLALARESVAAINPSNTGGRPFALHGSMSALATLFSTGKAAAVANVGPLVKPTTRSQWQTDDSFSPPNLFSHSDQQNQWQSAAADVGVRQGWGGRIADQVAALNGVQNIATAIAVNGRSFFQQGAMVAPYAVSPSGYFGFESYDPKSTSALSVGFGEMINVRRTHLFEAAWNDVIKRGIDTQQVFQSALNQAPALTTVFPQTGIGDQLQTIARLIAVRASLGVKRQVYFASIGGFDTHGADQLQDQGELLGAVSNAMAAFYRAAEEMNVAQQVTAFTMSDFGRDFPANGNGGSDHGWGSHHVVVGGAVQGNKLYGTFPVLRVNGPDDTSGGRWIPSTATEQYAASLARWFGLSSAELSAAFPTLSRFPTGLLALL